MKVFILAGGMGTRLAEETDIKPKPMVEIGGRPILWHIMKGYRQFGFNEFVIALGYRGDMIKRYFLDYASLNCDLTVELGTGHVSTHGFSPEDWTVHLMDTGLLTTTGGRIKRLHHLAGGETIMLTYGDGVGSVNFADLLAFHRAHGKIATVTAVRPPARFGAITFEGQGVMEFREKPQTGEGWISGGFFVCEPQVFDYIHGDSEIWEREPMERLVADKQLQAYQHQGFWQGMDTIRDVRSLNAAWESGQAPWKTWAD